jgi:hypothetical protein
MGALQIARLHDASRGVDLPCFILGTTNPFFIKSLEHWPNAIWLTPSVGFTASSVASQTVQTSDASPVAAGSPKPAASSASSASPQADRVRPKVAVVFCFRYRRCYALMSRFSMSSGDSCDLLAMYCTTRAWSRVHRAHLFGVSL